MTAGLFGPVGAFYKSSRVVFVPQGVYICLTASDRLKVPNNSPR